MKLPLPQRTLREYITAYQKEHTQRGTKLTHMIGIPMIVASFPAAFVSPPLAGGLFAGGWVLQIIGHKVYEKNEPAFLSDPYYLLVGPVWVAAEWLELLGLPVPEVFQGQRDVDAAAGEHVNGASNGEAVAAT